MDGQQRPTDKTGDEPSLETNQLVIIRQGKDGAHLAACKISFYSLRLRLGRRQESVTFTSISCNSIRFICSLEGRSVGRRSFGIRK